MKTLFENLAEHTREKGSNRTSTAQLAADFDLAMQYMKKPVQGATLNINATSMAAILSVSMETSVALIGAGRAAEFYQLLTQAVEAAKLVNNSSPVHQRLYDAARNARVV